MRRVVITGIGTINPIGNNIQEYFEGLKEGRNGCDYITRFDASKFKAQFACEVKNFNPTDHFDRKEARKYDRFAQFALVATEEAMKDSAIDIEAIDQERAGVIWASGIGGLDSITEAITDFNKGDGTPRFSPFFIPKMIIDIAAGHISMKYGFKGPNYGTVSACASANHAIIDAMNHIRWDKADIMITGGSEAAISPAGVGGFTAMQALSTRNDDPKTASRPFDTGRDGFIMGEGAGSLVLEELEHAKARGAKIYAEVVGGGMSADAYHFTSPHPNGMGAAQSMRNAIKDAGITVEDIDYVNTHGTSTPAGDLPEVTGLMTVFGKHSYKLNISSTKSMTGHLLGAAAAIEALACVMALKENIVPPTINHFELDKAIDHKLNFTFNEAQEREVKYALSNTFGFGGHNSTVVLKKYEE